MQLGGLAGAAAHESVESNGYGGIMMKGRMRARRRVNATTKRLKLLRLPRSLVPILQRYPKGNVKSVFSQKL